MAEDVEQQLRALATQVAQRYKDGDYAQALALAQTAYDLIRKLADPDPLSVAASMHTLGEHYRAMQVYEQALPIVHQALTLRHEVLGLAHPLVAASMHTLGEIHQESLMVVESVICGYIRVRTGDTHATDEITQATRLSLCGYSRARTGGAHAANEVTEEAFRALVRAGFAKYDPAKGRLTTYAKGCAHLMLVRYYTAQQQGSRVTRLLSEFRARYSGFNAEADTRDVLERLPAVATPSREAAVIATEESHLRQQVLDELYRITFAGNLCPPHEVIALGFCKLWRAQVDEEAGPSPGQSVVRWPPRRMVTELSDTPLAILHTQLEDELVEKSELPAERVRTHLRGVRESMAHGVDRLVHAMLPQQRATKPATAERHPMYILRRWMCAFASNALHRQVAEEISKAEYAHLLQALQAWVVGKTTWQHYYTSTRPADDIGHWCEDVQRQVHREIRTQGKGHLFLMLQQAKERRGRT